jgi:hypothetical protein
MYASIIPILLVLSGGSVDSRLSEPIAVVADEPARVAVARAQVTILHKPKIEPRFVRGEIQVAGMQREVTENGHINIVFQ